MSMVPTLPPAPPPTSLSSTLTTGTALVFHQLITRVFTFTLNQTLVRISPPEVFGTAAIQFDLLCSTILFLSREGIRNALLRTRYQKQHAASTASDKAQTEEDISIDVKPQRDQQQQRPSETQIKALSTLPFQLGLIVSLIVVSIYLYSLPSTTTTQPNFHLSLTLYVLSTWIELSIEPLYLKAIRSVPPQLGVRIQAEGGMTIVKAVVTVVCLVVFQRTSLGSAAVSRSSGNQGALLAFAVGQISGSLWLAGRYIREFGAGFDLFWISMPEGESRFHPSTFSLAWANTRQSFVKHLLTESDRFAVSYISPLGDQGGYAVAMNYGSLIARIIFQPMEETLLLHFTSSLTSPETPELLTYILHISSHLLLLLPIFLPPLYSPIIPLLLPKRYLTSTTASKTLESYLKFYLPLLSLNGLIESFHAASADSRQVAMQMRWMIGGSFVFATTLWSLRNGLVVVRKLGGGKGGLTTEQALIYASCASMIVRIVYAYRHASRYFLNGRRSVTPSSSSPAVLKSAPYAPRGTLSIRRILPKNAVIILTILSGIILRIIERSGRWKTSWMGWMELVGTGAFLGLAVLYVIYRVERHDFISLRKAMSKSD